MLLKGKLGLPAAQPAIATGALADAADMQPLDTLVARALRRGDVERADRAVPVAQAVAKREGRSGVPVPRALLGAGRENEEFAHVGLDVPIPVYQRNQTNRAVADARVATAGAEQSAARIAADTSSAACRSRPSSSAAERRRRRAPLISKPPSRWPARARRWNAHREGCHEA